MRGSPSAASNALAPRSGHRVPEENPKFLSDTVLRFL
jgi:hypothetical protein